MDKEIKPRRSPLFWVPTLYFAEGLPFFAVAKIAGIMLKGLGVSNDRIGAYTSLLLWAWVVKPLWSPFLETFQSKKRIVIVFQFAGGLALGLTALCLPLPNFLAYSVALLGVVALCSATHDIAADGLYIANLAARQQDAYAGWQGGFYNLARLCATGGMVTLAGVLVGPLGTIRAWMVVLGVLGGLMILLSLYHIWSLPGETTSSAAPRSVGAVYQTLKDVLISFFRKKNVLLMIAFIVLFQAGEGQVQTIGPLFLIDPAEDGGLELTMKQVGAVYGAFGSITFIAGSVLGGYFTYWLGLRRSLWILVLAMNLPNMSYIFLSTVLPSNWILIATSLGIEMFGYGFGSVGLILFMMQEVAPGNYQTAHYALATGLMALGVTLFTMVSGYIQMMLGYQTFFLWVLAAAVPSFILAWTFPFHDELPAAKVRGRVALGYAISLVAVVIVCVVVWQAVWYASHGPRGIQYNPFTVAEACRDFKPDLDGKRIFVEGTITDIEWLNWERDASDPRRTAKEFSELDAKAEDRVTFSVTIGDASVANYRVRFADFGPHEKEWGENNLKIGNSLKASGLAAPPQRMEKIDGAPVTMLNLRKAKH